MTRSREIGAIAAADPARDLLTRSLVVIEAERYLEHQALLLPHAAHLMVRLSAGDVAALAAKGMKGEALRELLAATRVVELAWNDAIARGAARVLAANPELLLSVFLRYGD